MSSAQAYNNGLGMKPFLGWQSWCAVGKCGTDACYDRQVRQTAKAMVDNGMKQLGFEWVVIDDCWCAHVPCLSGAHAPRIMLILTRRNVRSTTAGRHPTRAANGTLVPFAPYCELQPMCPLSCASSRDRLPTRFRRPALCPEARVRGPRRAIIYLFIYLTRVRGPRRAINCTVPASSQNAVPNGMKAVADYVHSLGLKFGLCQFCLSTVRQHSCRQ